MKDEGGLLSTLVGLGTVTFVGVGSAGEFSWLFSDPKRASLLGGAGNPHTSRYFSEKALITS